MPIYSLAIFDFDGTLADSFPWFCSVLNNTAKRFGFREVGPEEIEKLRTLGTREIVANLGVPMWRMPAIALHMRKLSANSGNAVELFPGVENMLEALVRSGVKVAIVSSNSEATIRNKLGRSAGLIDHYSCGSSLWGKASRIKAVLKHFSVPLTAAVFIGDEVRDIEAARKAGVASGVVTFGYNTVDALRAHQPDLEVDSLRELVAKLTNNKDVRTRTA